MGLVALAALTLAVTGERSLASATDTVSSGPNAFGSAALPAPSLAAPVVTGTGATATVSLSWTPGAGDFATSYEVLRAAGACPGASYVVVGTVAAPSTAHVDIPGAAGSYCYAVRGAFQGWRSALSNERQVTVPPGAANSTLRFRNSTTAAPNACSGSASANQLTLAAGSPGTSFNLNSGATRNWLGLAGDGLTTLGAGSYTVTLSRLANSPQSTQGVTITARLGYCEGGAFVQLGTANLVYSGGAQTISATITLGSSTALTSTRLVAVQLENTGNGSSRDFLLDTDGDSLVSGPVN